MRFFLGLMVIMFSLTVRATEFEGWLTPDLDYVSRVFRQEFVDEAGKMISPLLATRSQPARKQLLASASAQLQGSEYTEVRLQPIQSASKLLNLVFSGPLPLFCKWLHTDAEVIESRPDELALCRQKITQILRSLRFVSPDIVAVEARNSGGELVLLKLLLTSIYQSRQHMVIQLI